MTPRVLTTVAVLGALAAAACGGTTSPSPETSGQGLPLIEAATTGVTFTNDLNPFDPNSVARAMNLASLTYEPLYEFDSLDPTPSGTHPWLATAYSFSAGGRSLTITVRNGVRFNDGSVFGAADVAATFRAIRAQPRMNWSGVPTQSADPVASGDTVTLTFETAQYTNLWAVLGTTWMVPATLAQRLTADPTLQITNPVGTGPFMLRSYSSSVIRFVPNPHYWGGTPPESEVDVPAIADNNAAAAALVGGRLDWAGNAIPNVYETFVNLNPETNHAWFAAANTVTLWFNAVSAGAPSLRSAAVRRAISMAIDRRTLALLGEAGYEQPATSSSGLILPNQRSYLPVDGSLTGDLPATAEASAAQAARDDWSGDSTEKELTADGWAAPAGWGTPRQAACDGSNPANCWTKNGQIISFSIYDPVPFSDYWACANLVSQQLQKAGMAVTASPAQGYSDWNDNLLRGNFQAAIHWGAGGSMPYVQYDNWLDPAAIGISGNYGRYVSARATVALAAYAGTDPGDETMLNRAVQDLARIMSDEAPAIPLLYGAAWNVYSSVKYTGWPNAEHPYMNPSPNDPQLPYILMHLKPAV